MFLEVQNGLIQQQYYDTSRSIFSTHNARYFPSKLTESVEIGFPKSLLYPILFQSLMFQTAVTTLEPAPVMNTDLVKISLPSMLHMYNSQDQLKAHLLQQCKTGTVSCHP
jgi:hypothetical protein